MQEIRLTTSFFCFFFRMNIALENLAKILKSYMLIYYHLHENYDKI